jgi:hypothetical protein
MIKCKSFTKVKSLKYYPCDSSKLGIVLVSVNSFSDEFYCKLDSLERKCILLPYEIPDQLNYMCIPML